MKIIGRSTRDLDKYNLLAISKIPVQFTNNRHQGIIDVPSEGMNICETEHEKLPAFFLSFAGDSLYRDDATCWLSTIGRHRRQVGYRRVLVGGHFFIFSNPAIRMGDQRARY